MKVKFGIIVAAVGVFAASAHAEGLFDKNMVVCNDLTHKCDDRSNLVTEDYVKRPFSAAKDYQKIYSVPGKSAPPPNVLVVDTQKVDTVMVSRAETENVIVLVREVDGVKWAYRTRGSSAGE